MIAKLPRFKINRMYYTNSPTRVADLEKMVTEIVEKVNELVDAVNQISGGAQK